MPSTVQLSSPQGSFTPGFVSIPASSTYIFNTNPVTFIPDNPGQAVVDISYTFYKNGNQVICQDYLTINLDQLQAKEPGTRKSAGNAGEFEMDMRAIPNPAHHTTRVEYAVDNPKEFQRGTLKLYSLSGHLVESRTVNQAQGQARFDLSNLSSGTYVVVFFEGGRRIGQQMLIRE